MAFCNHKLLARFIAVALLATSAATANEPGTQSPTVTRAAAIPARLKSAVDPAAFYPPEAKRRGEQGSPVVQVCVDASGKLSREPVITQTSGFPEIDGAAIKVAKANTYGPAMEGGVPLPESCVKFRVKFDLSYR